MKKTNDIGLDAKPPKDSCNLETCPWHGKLKVRGRVFKGEVVSDKAPNTCIVQWHYYNYVPKYERSERKKTKVAAHNPPCINAKKGDIVKIAECRPLSKTKRFVIIEKLR